SARNAATIASALTLAMGETSGPDKLDELARGLLAVSAQLRAEDASAAARALADALANAPNTADSRSLMHALRAISEERLSTSEAASRAVLAARAVGESAFPSARFSGLNTLMQASQPLPNRLTTQQLVDLLKMPTCIGEARTVVLEMLGQRYH